MSPYNQKAPGRFSGIIRPKGTQKWTQKWRYTHLQETDEITGVTTHQVRGKDGYVLTPFELEREKPKFIDVPLVEAGDRFPFYDDYMASIGGISILMIFALVRLSH